MKNPVSFLFTKEAKAGYVENRRLFSYSVGLAGQNMTYSFISNWLFYYANVLLHIDSKKVGYITSISKVWDAINDPMIGAIVDRRRCKSGEKLRPYLIKLPPIIGILSAIMFINYGLPPSTMIVIIIIIFLVWDYFYSFQDVALWGMVAASSPHSEERSRVAQWVSIGAGAGSSIAGTFPLIKSESNLERLGISAATMFMIGAFVFGLGGELISMFAYNMKEQVHSEKPKENVLHSLTIIRHNRELLLISAARFAECLSLTVPWPYFFESQVSYQIGSTYIDGGTSQFLYGLIIGIPGAFAIFAATKFARKIGGMKKILILSQLSSILIRIISYFIGFQTLPQIGFVMLLMSLTSIPSSMKDIAHRSITSDSIDYVEWKTGFRTEGISFSIQNFISKITSSVGLFINGLVLSRLGFDSKISMTLQNTLFMKWQWPLFMLGPAIGATLYLFVIIFVRDDMNTKRQIEQDLRERREEKAKLQGIGI